MLKNLARSAFHRLRGPEVFRRLNSDGVRVLFYHHFSADVETLRRQCEHIRRFYRVVSMREIAHSLQSGTPLPPCSVAVTIDDGYRDFLNYAYPVFHAFEIPTTVFLVSDFLDGNGWLWWDSVEYLLEHTGRESLTLTSRAGASRTFALNDPASMQAVCDFLKTVPNEERLQMIRAIGEQLDVELPPQPPAHRAPLSWSEVRELAGNSVEVGAHTRSHPILSRIEDETALRDEIAACKIRIETEVGQPVIHFCYPNGESADFTEQAVDVVRESGYVTAVTTERGMNFPGAEPLLLKRIGAEPYMPVNTFSELLAGVRRR